jgi:hypothetical protein
VLEKWSTSGFKIWADAWRSCLCSIESIICIAIQAAPSVEHRGSWSTRKDTI